MSLLPGSRSARARLESFRIAISFAVALGLTAFAWPSGIGAAREPAAAPAIAPPAPVYAPPALPPELEESFKVKKFTLDPGSGNYLAPKVSGTTPNEDLVPILINNRYEKDLAAIRSSCENRCAISSSPPIL